MKARDLARIGIPAGRCADAARQILREAHASKRGRLTVLDDLRRVAASPVAFLDDGRYAGLAQLLLDRVAADGRFVPREVDAPYQIWGDNLEATAVQQLKNAGVTLLSAGLGEVPMAYKDIEQVMASQRELVEPLARFDPRLVKMAPGGEPPED